MTAIDTCDRTSVKLAKYYKLMILFLDQYVPETKSKSFEIRMIALGKKLENIKADLDKSRDE